MPILGTKITRMEATRKKDGVAPEGMAVNVNIKDAKNDKGRLSVKFEYAIQYTPDFAEMKIEGELYLPEDKKAEDEFKKTKSLPKETTEEVLTALTYTSSAIGTLLAFGLGISAPINVSRVHVGEQPQTKAG